MNITPADIGKKFRTSNNRIITLQKWDGSAYPFKIEEHGEWLGVHDNGVAYDILREKAAPDWDLVGRVADAESCVPCGGPIPGNPKHTFAVKDSGERQQFSSGMQRDTSTGKIRPDLVKDGPMYLRWVNLMTRGAVKYEARNWMKASGDEEYDRFLESADRHFTIWYTWRMYGINIENIDSPTREPLTEDHAAAVMFNINGVEFVAEQKSAP